MSDGIPSSGAGPGILSARNIWIATSLAAAITISAGLGYQVFKGSNYNGASSSIPTFVGSETCAGCHRGEADLWRTSQHKHAMDHATDKSVLGDFNDASFDYYGVRSRFFPQGRKIPDRDRRARRQTRRRLRSNTRSASTRCSNISSSFPMAALQALSLAWDSRPKDKGGQRWFHLYPNEEIKHDDILHWTKLNQNWNFMCAECHSTGVRKNYDAARRSICHDLGGNQRRLRGLPRTGFSSCRLGAFAAKLVAVRKERRPEQGTARSVQ